jgi:hypothetical protein
MHKINAHRKNAYKNKRGTDVIPVYAGEIPKACCLIYGLVSMVV